MTDGLPGVGGEPTADPAAAVPGVAVVGSGRPRRADARRNYDLLLAAAKEIFTEYGAAAPLDDIARRAGVGNATMYRHFPTRQDLLVAVYADEVAEVCTDGEALLAADSPGDALFNWLATLIAHMASKRELAQALAEAYGERSEIFGRWHHAMLSTGAALLARAQGAGDVRADLDVRELLTMASGIALTGADHARAARLLFLLRNGTAPPT